MPDLSRKETQRAIDRLDIWRNNENEAMTAAQTNSYERTWANDAERRSRGLTPAKRRVFTDVIRAVGIVAALLLVVLIVVMVMAL